MLLQRIVMLIFLLSNQQKSGKDQDEPDLADAGNYP
jgi:hypothetical protein